MSNVGTFFGLNIGRSALLTSSAAQDIVGNNIANADTDGYSVQSADIVAGPVTTTGLSGSFNSMGQFGNGVAMAKINRARDMYLDQSLRDALSRQGTQNGAKAGLTEVQNNVNEPSSTGISSAMTSFFNSLSDVQNNPEDTGIRATAVGKAQQLAQVFSSTQAGLDSTRVQMQAQVDNDVENVNSLATQIANLNVEINRATALGQQPNTLLDQRDVALDNLSKLANIKTSAQPDGSVNVSIGGTQIVSGSTTNTVTLASLTANGDLKDGSLAGDASALTDLADYQTKMDDLANEIMGQVNAVHKTGAGLDGTTGLDLFTGTDARTMSVNSVIVADPNKLAVGVPTTAGGKPATGDASNILAMYNLKDKVITAGPLSGQTMQGFYTNMVTELGQKVSNAANMSSASSASVKQLTAQKASVSGVNLDEEMTNMIKYQRAYQAAAKIITTNADMLDMLIGMVK
ncbi:MAG TPA: flagellar hook-associated protein FlgK [Capsulimonadaceae bacterium]|jgi:flagellar hook-associated protein 1 FlgK